jgi:hypothetical protein
LAIDLCTQALSDELVCLPLIGEADGKNLESILFISPMQIYETLYLLFRA